MYTLIRGMVKKMLKKSILMICIGCLLVGCTSSRNDITKKTYDTTQADVTQVAQGRPFIAKTVEMSQWDVKVPKKLPKYVRENEGNAGWDLRHLDLRAFDLSENNDLRNTIFDTSTIWPENLPSYFVPNTILEAGKNPGLGVRDVHAAGFTGKGISIAIIGETPSLEHVAYKDQIKLYETMHNADTSSTFQGSAMASLIAGKQNGVAPEANLYYIASTFTDYNEESGEYVLNLNYMADAINRVIEINKSLPQNQKIRVLAIGRSFDNKGGEDEKRVSEAIQNAINEGIFVASPSLIRHYGVNLVGLSRQVDKTPENLISYRLGSWENITFVGDKPLYVPKDARTVADYTTVDGYQFIPVGSDDFAVAYLAGLYALSAQAFPTLTGDRFLRYLIDYGDFINITDEDQKYVLRNIVNPLDSVKALKAAVGIVQ